MASNAVSCNYCVLTTVVAQREFTTVLPYQDAL